MLILAFTACKNNQPEVSETKSDLIEITKEQFLTENMEFGKPVHMLFENRLHLTGKIIPDINGVAKISATIDGIIEKIYVQKGQFVQAGEVILEIGGSTLIDLQQSFTTSSAKLQQLKSDFDRTKTLYNENIKTEKEFMLSESAYKSELANYSALKLKLQNIGLNLTDIDNGVYASSYKIITPIEGQVANLNTTLGQFISPQLDIAEILNTEKVQLQLAVFERDFSKIKPGLKVRFKTASEKNNYSTATITRVSKILNSKSKSFDCFAELHQSDKSSLIINQLVSAEVIIESDSVYAVPQTAIVTSGLNKFIYVKDSEDDERFLLDKINVRVGRTSNGFIELNDVYTEKKILVTGTYNISID